jgi:hypothetical protein
MRVLLAALALLPALATAQVDLGTYQITSGSEDVIGGGERGTFAGNRFTGTIQGYPGPFYGLGRSLFFGENDFSTLIEPIPGNDEAFYLQLSGINTGSYVPLTVPSGLLDEYGQMSTPLIDVTGGGTYTDTFTLSADLYYGQPGSQTESAYINVVGHGTFTFDVVTPPGCIDPSCSMQITSLKYTFAPELDPTSLASALTLLGGGLLVIRGRRSRIS